MSSATGAKRPRPTAIAREDVDEDDDGVVVPTRVAAAAKTAKAAPKSAAATTEYGDEDGLARSGSGGDGNVALRDKILQLLTDRKNGCSAKQLQRVLGVPPATIGPLLIALMDEGRVEVLRSRAADTGVEVQIWRAVAPERAAKLKGLTQEDQAVLGIIEKSGNLGVWVRSIKLQSKIQPAQLNKTLKRLETRSLVKAVTNIAFKSRRIYMGFDCEPSTELTGGVWYNEATLDTGFIEVIRQSALSALVRLGGTGNATQVCARIAETAVSRVPLKPSDIVQVLDALLLEGWVDYADAGRARVAQLERPEHALFPSRALLIAEKTRKGRGAAGAGAGDRRRGPSAGGAGADAAAEDDDGDEGGSGDDGDDGADGGAAGPALRRLYSVAKGSATHVHAHADHLSAVPCGTCPVAAACQPGGLVSPETCLYMSHWLQW